MQIFNDSTKDLWLPLALGVCLVCLSQAIHADGFGADPRDDNPATKISQGIATQKRVRRLSIFAKAV
jgi:hypothetical protein